MNDDQIKHMVNRFLGWRLPGNFRPDCGISFDADAAKKLDPRNQRYEPHGTSLFDGGQAEAMVRHMIEGLPTTGDCKTCGGRQTIRIVNDLYRADHDEPCPTCIGWPVRGPSRMVIKVAFPTDGPMVDAPKRGYTADEQG